MRQEVDHSRQHINTVQQRLDQLYQPILLESVGTECFQPTTDQQDQVCPTLKAKYVKKKLEVHRYFPHTSPYHQQSPPRYHTFIIPMHRPLFPMRQPHAPTIVFHAPTPCTDYHFPYVVQYFPCTDRTIDHCCKLLCPLPVAGLGLVLCSYCI